MQSRWGADPRLPLTTTAAAEPLDLFDRGFKALSTDEKLSLIDRYEAAFDRSTPRPVRLKLFEERLRALNTVCRVNAILAPHKTAIFDAENGEHALKVLEQQKDFDGVLLDMHMPILNGPEIIKRIQASKEPWRDIPVVALTADAMEGDKEKYLAMGMDGYIAKPIVVRELLETLGAVYAPTKIESLEKRPEEHQDA